MSVLYYFERSGYRKFVLSCEMRCLFHKPSATGQAE